MIGDGSATDDISEKTVTLGCVTTYNHKHNLSACIAFGMMVAQKRTTSGGHREVLQFPDVYCKTVCHFLIYFKITIVIGALLTRKLGSLSASMK